MPPTLNASLRPPATRAGPAPRLPPGSRRPAVTRNQRPAVDSTESARRAPDTSASSARPRASSEPPLRRNLAVTVRGMACSDILIDSGCSNTVINDSRLYTGPVTAIDEVSSTATGATVRITHHGTVPELGEARYCRSFKNSLLSVSQDDKLGHWTIFGGGQCMVVDRRPIIAGKVVRRGVMIDDLYHYTPSVGRTRALASHMIADDRPEARAYDGSDGSSSTSNRDDESVDNVTPAWAPRRNTPPAMLTIRDQYLLPPSARRNRPSPSPTPTPPSPTP